MNYHEFIDFFLLSLFILHFGFIILLRLLLVLLLVIKLNNFYVRLLSPTSRMSYKLYDHILAHNVTITYQFRNKNYFDS